MFDYYLYFVLLLLALFFVYIVKDLLRAVKSKSWVEAEGIIVESKLLSHGRSMMMGRNYERYSALIKYEYDVSSKKYEGDRVRFFPMGTSVSKKTVERLVSEYDVGDVITVFYDPDKPDQCLLKKGLNLKAFLTLIAILFFMGFVFFMIGDG